MLGCVAPTGHTFVGLDVFGFQLRPWLSLPLDLPTALPLTWSSPALCSLHAFTVRPADLKRKGVCSFPACPALTSCVAAERLCCASMAGGWALQGGCELSCVLLMFAQGSATGVCCSANAPQPLCPLGKCSFAYHFIFKMLYSRGFKACSWLHIRP